MGRVCHGPSLLWAELSSYRGGGGVKRGTNARVPGPKSGGCTLIGGILHCILNYPGSKEVVPCRHQYLKYYSSDFHDFVIILKLKLRSNK